MPQQWPYDDRTVKSPTVPPPPLKSRRLCWSIWPFRCDRQRRGEGQAVGGRTRNQTPQISRCFRMPDVFDQEKRSQVMSNIRGSGNQSTEVRLISVMKEHGIKGWRRRRPVFGSPDFVFYDGKVAVFVDGCFWHGCPEHYKPPQSNTEYWQSKHARNKSRDDEVTSRLVSRGWQVLRIWEHELIRSTRDQAADRLVAALRPVTSVPANKMLRVAEPTANYEVNP